jgi:8-oxo-dGTP pyrophosphatase MutT (NUDIX family)
MEELSSYLKEKLNADLPGERAHVEMAPIHRPLPSEAKNWPDTKYSGVLVFIYPQNDRWHTSLMLRTDYGGVHSAQVSFPGGRVEDEDENITHTALREAEEELAIPKKSVSVLGELSQLYIPPSKSLVTPVVGISESRPDFIPEEREVQEIIEADLFDMFQEKYFQNTEIVTSKYLMREVPAILYKGHTIWGATAMILNEFKWILREFNE